MNAEQEKKLKGIFANILGVDESKITDSIAYNSFEPWDSLKHLQLVSEMEEAFGVQIEMDDIIAMENFKVVKQILGKYLHK
jgi:acyl carrier protein